VREELREWNPKWLSAVYIYTEHDIGPRWTVWALSWANIFRDGPYSVAASVNVLTEAVVLK
jgi:hypothetical protein